MRLEKIKNSKRNIAFGIINKIIKLLFPFVIRTIVIQKLGAEYLGLNSLFSSILQILSLAELGFGSAIAFGMYKPVSVDDNKTICALLNFYKKVYRIIGIIILIVGLLLMPVIKVFIMDGQYPRDVNIYTIYLIYLANTVISYMVFAYEQSILNAYQRNDIESNVESIVYILGFSFQIVLLVLLKNYYIYIICLPIITLLINLVRHFIIRKKYPMLYANGEITLEERKEIKKRVTSLIGHKIGALFLNSVDSIVISTFLGLTLLAKYNNYYYIISGIGGILTICYTAILSGIGNSMELESKEKNYNHFSKLFFANNWLIGWCSICLMCLYQPFMELWVGKEMVLNYSMVILFSLYFYIWYSRNIVLTFKDAAGMWEKDKYKPYVTCVANLILNVILVKFVGLEGVVISTVLTMACISLPWETIVLFKNYFKKSAQKYFLKYINSFVLTIVSAIVCVYLCDLIETIKLNLILNIFIRLIICTTITNILFFLFKFKTEDFKQTLQLVKRVIWRKIK